MNLPYTKLGIVLALGGAILLSACKTQKKSYDYLLKSGEVSSRSAGTEPYDVVDIDVLDTTQVVSAPPSGEKPPEGGGTVSTQEKKVAINTAGTYTGTPYLWGGTTQDGIDCSGLTMMSYQSAEVEIPRTSSEQAETGKPVKFKKISPGDIIFFASDKGTRINHCGLVIRVKGEEITFIHATSSKGVREDRLDSGYWNERWRKAVRL